MINLPEIALSVRQPWAWAIIHAGKDIENRSWQAVNHGLKQRGRIAIHASKGLGKEEYESARDFIDSILASRPDNGLRCPAAIDLKRGGIIGSVDVVDVVTDSDSDWFMGPRGLVLRGAMPCEFIPSIGALGYFAWKPADASVVPAPARWMIPVAAEPPAPKVIDIQGRLL
jgi:hypothetical protein